MNRSTTATGNGFSDSVLVPNGKHSNWLAIVIAVDDDWAGMEADLQASEDGTVWFDATDVSGPVIFSQSKAVIVSAGLHYRLSVTNHSSDVTLLVKPA
jgi:hypothetical protein